MKKYFILLLLISYFNTNIQAQFEIDSIRNFYLNFYDTHWQDTLDQYYINDTDLMVLANLTINGITYDSVGVRYKGNSSCSPGQIKNPFHIELDGGGGDFHIALPYSMLEPIRELLDAGVQSDRGDVDERWADALRQEMELAEVELSAILLRTQLTMRELVDLKPGDIIDGARLLSVKKDRVRLKKKGKIEGKIEGKKEEKIQIALKSLKKGLDVEMVAEITGLGVEEVASYKELNKL